MNTGELRALTAGTAGLSKVDTALALDYELALEKRPVRIAAALVAAAAVNVAFFSAVDRAALDARTPAGEVTVTQLEPVAEQTMYAQLIEADRR